MFPGIKEVKTPLGTETLTIATQEEIISVYGSSKYYITSSVLEDVEALKLNKIPFHKIHQIASTCFSRVNAFITGFKQQEALDIAKRISLLGGKFSPHFNNDINVVISSTYFSPRIYQVMESNIPIVSSEWVRKSFEGLTCFENSNFILPPFSGLHITSTDLTPSEHKKLKNIIERNGGTWSDNYDEKTTLVLSHSLCTSKKIEIALKENVPIIKPQWIYDCTIKFAPHSKYTINSWIENKEQGKLFKDVSFSINKDIENSEIITEIIKANGGEILEEATYDIVPFSAQKTQKTVTSRFIYDCVTEQTLLDCNSNILYTPLGYNLPLPDVQGKIFSLIDLPDSTRITAAEAIRIMGGKVAFKESKNTAFIVSTDSNNEKSVSSMFIMEAIEKGYLPDPKCFPALPLSPLLKKICLNIVRQAPPKITESPAKALDFDTIDQFTQIVSATASQDTIQYNMAPSQTQIREFSKGQNDPLLSILNDNYGNGYL